MSVVLPFLLILVCLFGLAVASMEVLSAVRAYVGGEGLWSKGQKQAVYHLTRYAASGEPAEFERYLSAIAVPLGDHRARVELEKPEPDYAVVRQGFLQGRNDAADINGMVRLFRYFHRLESIDRSIAIWAAADEHIARLTSLADRLRSAVESRPFERVRVNEALAEIDYEAGILTPLADAFSYTLGEASRQVARLLVVLLGVATAILTTLLVLFARGVLREREKHEQALHESEERYRSFFETSIDAVILGGPDGSIQAMNPAACIAFGFGESEMPGTGTDEIRGDVLEPLQEALREGARTGRFRGSLSFRRRDGRGFVGEVSSSRFTDASGNAGTSVIIRDISARIRAEEEIRRLNASLEERVASRTAELESVNRDLLVFNRELESFCYSVSHDLRLPLRSMSGFSELLLADYEQSLDERAHGYLHRIQGACRRMGRLIDDLLSLTRYTRQKLVPEPVDLASIAREVVEELRAEDPEREVEVDIAEGPLARAYGDLALLRVMLRSLLTNAWKFSAQVPRPKIGFGSRSEEGETVYFVSDNGCGFDMAYADKLFRVFNRLHAADEFEGTGIGLATVQRIVLRHGGRVWAESAPEAGATFYFTLAEAPAIEARAAAAGG